MISEWLSNILELRKNPGKFSKWKIIFHKKISILKIIRGEGGVWTLQASKIYDDFASSYNAGVDKSSILLRNYFCNSSPEIFHSIKPKDFKT